MIRRTSPSWVDKSEKHPDLIGVVGCMEDEHVIATLRHLARLRIEIEGYAPGPLRETERTKYLGACELVLSQCVLDEDQVDGFEAWADRAISDVPLVVEEVFADYEVEPQNPDAIDAAMHMKLRRELDKAKAELAKVAEERDALQRWQTRVQRLTRYDVLFSDRLEQKPRKNGKYLLVCDVFAGDEE